MSDKNNEQLVDASLKLASESTKLNLPTILSWQNSAFSRILQISLFSYLNSQSTEESKLFYSSILEDSDVPRDQSGQFPLLTTTSLERVLVFTLWNMNCTILLEYLVGCFERATNVERNLIEKCQTSDVEQRKTAITTLKTLIVNYVVLYFVEPGILNPLNSTCDSSATLAPADTTISIMLRLVTSTNFLAEVVENNSSLDEICGFIDALCKLIMLHLRLKCLVNPFDYSSSLHLMTHLLSTDQIANVFPMCKSFRCDIKNPKVFESTTLFGCLLRISGFFRDSPLALLNFLGNCFEASDMGATREKVSILRNSQNKYNKDIYEAFDKILRARPFLRGVLLDYLALGLKINKKRSAIQVDFKNVGSFGFVNNVTILVVDFCSPFMSKQNPKFHLIDLRYLLGTSCRFEVSETTRIGQSEKECDEYCKSLVENDSFSNLSFNFATECFFFAMFYMNVGYIRNLQFFTENEKFIRDVEKSISSIESELSSQRPEVLSNPRFRAILALRKQNLRQAKAERHSSEAILMSLDAQEKVFDYYTFVASLILRMLCGENYEKQLPEMPLTEIPQLFKALPEFLLDNIAIFVEFLLNFQRIAVRNSFDTFLEFFIVMMMNPSTIKNPHLKSKIVAILSAMTYHSQNVFLISNNSLSIKYLVPSLCQYYVDVELSGLSNQFYEKFGVRYQISKVLETVWGLTSHRLRIIELSGTMTFIKLVNMMMSDTRYLLDESVSVLTKINELQEEMRLPEWANLAETVREEKKKSLENFERNAQNYMLLATQTLITFKYLSHEIPKPFMTSEIIDRLAAMLDHNLSALVGPKAVSIKVANPEKYNFNRRKLLNDIIEIFLNLCVCPEFLDAVARDESRYKKDFYQKAGSMLLKWGDRKENEVAKIYKLVDEIETRVKKIKIDEEDLGEIPDEFLDPIMCTLMENPVILPTSGKTVDYSTISAYLLGEKRDPFNRKELAIENVIPNDDLMKKIKEFKEKGAKH